MNATRKYRPEGGGGSDSCDRGGDDGGSGDCCYGDNGSEGDSGGGDIWGGGGSCVGDGDNGDSGGLIHRHVSWLVTMILRKVNKKLESSSIQTEYC